MIEDLSEARHSQLAVVGEQLLAAARPDMLPLLRRHKLLMARLAAAQLADPEAEPVVPPAGSAEAAEVARQRALALGTRPGCANVGCTNLQGASEAALKPRRCSRCRTVRFCCQECNKAEWRQHKSACTLLASVAGEQP